jgi:hypothetical protein
MFQIILDEFSIFSQREKSRYRRIGRGRTKKYVSDRQIMRVIFSDEVPQVMLLWRGEVVSFEYCHCQCVVLKKIIIFIWKNLLLDFNFRLFVKYVKGIELSYWVSHIFGIWCENDFVNGYWRVLIRYLV